MSDLIQLTILVENTVQGRELMAEHGWSVQIRSAASCFLFDTGQSGLLQRNASVLGLDLASARPTAPAACPPRGSGWSFPGNASRAASARPCCSSDEIEPSLTMSEKKPVRLVFVCSGAADVGELTDRAARQMAREGIAAMSCLASIGARDPDITFNAQIADRVLLMDGCPQACARRTFEHAGIQRPWLHFDLSEVGFVKGDSPMTDESVQVVVHYAAGKLRT